jgi:hypothetical protein
LRRKAVRGVMMPQIGKWKTQNGIDRPDRFSDDQLVQVYGQKVVASYGLAHSECLRAMRVETCGTFEVLR